MLANLDYSVVGSDEVQILECKTAGEYGAKLWRDGVPLYVLCQVQHQLAVTGKKAAHICVLICGHETRIYKVTRSESVIQHIINAERYFWECVENDTPPESMPVNRQPKPFSNSILNIFHSVSKISVKMNKPISCLLN
jgi:predicted phage-related endonuclease